MSPIAIQSINRENQQITVFFNQSWFQEDIASLHQLLLKKIPNHCVKESIMGADRESVRLQWRDTEFMLNFDCYSQSCWFDTQEPDKVIETEDLFDLLSQNNENYA
jgi:nicotinamidase-related amidase